MKDNKLRRIDSVKNWILSWPCIDPSVLRIPTSRARLSRRLAVAKFMKLMQAMIRIKRARPEKMYMYSILPFAHDLILEMRIKMDLFKRLQKHMVPFPACLKLLKIRLLTLCWNWGSIKVFFTESKFFGKPGSWCPLS